jgi:hypothetical protein
MAQSVLTVCDKTVAVQISKKQVMAKIPFITLFKRKKTGKGLVFNPNLYN